MLRKTHVLWLFVSICVAGCLVRPGHANECTTGICGNLGFPSVFCAFSSACGPCRMIAEAPNNPGSPVFPRCLSVEIKSFPVNGSRISGPCCLEEFWTACQRQRACCPPGLDYADGCEPCGVATLLLVKDYCLVPREYCDISCLE